MQSETQSETLEGYWANEPSEISILVVYYGVGPWRMPAIAIAIADSSHKITITTTDLGLK
jgi:hypothetical protein